MEGCTTQQFAIHVTATKKEKFRFEFYVLGLVEESGEVCECLQYCNLCPCSTHTTATGLLLEIGDVLWYTFGLSLASQGVLPLPVNWPTTNHRTFKSGTKLMETTTKIAGCVKRILRKDCTLTDMRSQMLQLRDRVFEECAAIAARKKVSLEHCAAMNIQKIKERMKAQEMLKSQHCM